VSLGHVTTNPRNTESQDVVNNVNQSFDSFTSDYLQAQGTYFAADSDAARSVMRQYVEQRIDLLAAQLTSIFTHVRGSLNQLQVTTPGGPVILQTFLKTRIDGRSDKTLHFALLRRGPNQGAIPPVGMTDTTAALYTGEALTAIETSRTVTLNSVGFLCSRSFSVAKLR
jgi:hypothetical protein